MENKVISLKEAVSRIPDSGAEVALGGFAITRNPIAFVVEMIRQGKKDLNLIEGIGSMDADLLVGSGCVKKYSYSGGSLDRFGRLGRINSAIARGDIEVNEYTGLSMTQRFLAGSIGLEFITMKTLLGSDILNQLLEKKVDGVMVEKSPFSDEKLVYLKALKPDFVVIHAQYADQKGNVIIEGPRWDIEMAKAARNLFVTVEQVVSNNYIKKFPEKVVIPSVSTTAVIEVPFGAFPTAVYKSYDYCSDTLTHYAKINENDEEFKKFLNENILSTNNHFEFLDKLANFEKLMNLRADPDYGYMKRG